jgi:hypothetical protein
VRRTDLIAVCCSERPMASATLMNRFAKRVSRIGSGPLPSFLSLVFIELIVLVKVQQRVEEALTVECLSRRRETSWIRRPARPLPSDHNLARLRWLACALRLGERKCLNSLLSFLLSS